MRFRKDYIDYKGRKTYDYGNEGGTTVGGTVIYGSSSSSTPSTKPQSSPQSPIDTGNTASTNTVVSMVAYETNTGDTAGHWTAEVDGLTHISDGTLVSMRISTACYSNSEGYNTLNINGTGAKMVWFDYGKPLKQELSINDEVLLVYREDAGRYTLPNPNPGGLSSDVFPSDGTVRSGWIIVSSDLAAKAGDMKNYYTRDEVDTLITEAFSRTVTSGQVLTMLSSYLEDNNYIHSELISPSEYENLDMPDSNTLYITGRGNYLGTIDMCCGGSTAETPYYVVNPLYICSDISGGTYTISVMSNTGYTLQSSDNWFTFSPQSGYGYGEFSVVIPSGDTYRAGSIVIGDKTVSVVQEPLYVIVDPSTITAAPEESSYTVTITANTIYNISADSPWTILSINSGNTGVTTLLVTIPSNSGETRTGNILVGNTNVVVTQYGAVDYYASQYLTMEILTGGSIQHSSGYSTEYRINGGEWVRTQYYSGINISVSARDKIEWRGYSGPSVSFGGSAYFNLSGNINSLGGVFDESFTGITSVAEAAYLGLFTNSRVIDATNLILTGMSVRCYEGMFHHCTGLKYPPQFPNTTLANYCYEGMFDYCTALERLPYLPATEIPIGAYQGMFGACTSLTGDVSLNNIVTAKTEACYGMFVNCKQITSASIRNCTKIYQGGFQLMFDNCTSLQSAYTNSVSVVANDACDGMFSGCTSISYINMGSLKTPYQYAFNNWLKSASTTGTFVKHPSASWVTGTDGIPNNWRIVNAT